MAPKESTPGDPFVGTFVGERFLVKRKIGEGGMGVVYEAEQTAIDRRVALKVLHPHLTDEELYARFRNEAAASSRLEHPNTITVYDFGRTENNSLYIAMEFITGTSLDDDIKKNGAVEWQRACRIGAQICSSLRNAHEHGIIHRDMKPENIMLCQRGDDGDFVKVLDFGIAKILEEDGTDQRKALTKTGMVFGTPQYMSPEQIRGEKIDARSDIYSVGVILYQMLTGKLPFKADTPMGLLTRHLMDPPPPFRDMNAGNRVPSALEALVMKTLAKDAAERPQTMKELGHALDALIGIGHSGKTTVAGAVPVGLEGGSFEGAGAVGTPSAGITGMTERRGSGPVVAIVVVAALLLLAAGAGAWYFLVGPGAASPDADDTGEAGTAVEAPVPPDSLPGDGDAPDGNTGDDGKAAATEDPAPTPGTTADSDKADSDATAAADMAKDETTKTTGKSGTGTKKKTPTDSGSGTTPATGGGEGEGDGRTTLADRLAGGGDSCSISAAGDKSATYLARALRKQESAMKACVQDGTISSTFGYTMAEGSSTLSGVAVSSAGNAAQAACVLKILKAARLVKPAEVSKSGTVNFSTVRTGGVLSQCRGTVQL